MTIWIVTTGSSDIQLKDSDHWNHLYGKVSKQFNNLKFSQPQAADYQEYAQAPARVLGVMYAQQPAYWNDLVFPLLHSFSEKLKSENIKPTKIILLLTNQEEIFSPTDKRLIECPYWQDTCTLQPLLDKYLAGKFPNATRDYLELKPTTKPGLEHWDSTLELVRETLSSLEVSKNEDIYVSHQAGTPAISSAVQFVTLGRFGKKVKFVVGSEYYAEEADIIDSSRYLRGIQVQQAKILIQENFPGAALKLLDKIEGIDSQVKSDLRDMVDIFNLNRPLGDGGSELEIQPATQRIVDALDLIGIFFSQRNYLQGIALLAAAQETFLKVAIWSRVRGMNDEVTLQGSSIRVSQLVEWTAQGLILNNGIISCNIGERNAIITCLKFPRTYPFTVEGARRRDLVISQSWMFTWLRQLERAFKPWQLLEWSCKYKDINEEHEDDIRNQLMHNLRGVEEKDVVKYLLGNREEDKELSEAYNKQVKEPFHEAIKLFGLPHTRETLFNKLQAIADSIS